MRPVTLTLVSFVAAANSISTSQTPLAAGNLTITGSLATGGVATMPSASQVIIHSAANDTARTFTITGTDSSGNPLVEAVTGANAGNATSVHRFKTVTQIHVDAATAGAVTAGTAAVNYSDPCPMDFHQTPFNVGLGFKDSGSTTLFTVQHSFEDPWSFTSADDYNANAAWFDHEFMTGMNASTDGNYAFPVRGIRLKSDQSGTDTGTLTIIQASGV